jgi:hypothetical protein
MFISVIMLFFSVFILYTITSFAQENINHKPGADNSRGNEKIFTFHRVNNGKDNYWKVVFNNGKISDLYKNGVKINGEDIDGLTGMIDEELEGLRYGTQNLNGNPFRVNLNMNNLDSLLSHLKGIRGSINFADSDSIFNNEQFPKDMDSLSVNMKKMHNIKFNFYFDTSAFNRGMKELSKSLKYLKIDPNIYLYKNEFPGCGLEAFKDEMKSIDKEIDDEIDINKDNDQ